MKKNPGKFVFKQFSVSHHRSAIRIGVDGVLVGSWADASDARTILDAGTGCGVIALMMAQRFPGSFITAIDIDENSVEEARENVGSSIWKDQIDVKLESFDSIDSGSRFDFIVSNPPFFDAGLSDASTPREMARHQGGMSPLSLLSAGTHLLSDHGGIAMIAPADQKDNLLKESRKLGYGLTRLCLVRGHVKAPIKRALLQWERGCDDNPALYDESPILTLESAPGIPTPEYRTLCKDFYLKF